MKECSIFSSRGIKLSEKSWNNAQENQLYSLITILRVFKLKRKLRDITETMENHLEIWKEKEDFPEKFRFVVDFVIKVLKLQLSEDAILKIITRSYTNDFSYNLPNGSQVTIYYERSDKVPTSFST